MTKKFFALILAVTMLLAIPMVSVAQTVDTNSSRSSWLVHIVQPEESLWLIGRQHGVDVGTLKKINNLQSDMILKGHYLAVKPVSDSHSFFLHTVRAGDTPWMISQRFGVSHRVLMDINGLRENSTIYPGQALKVPTQVQAASVHGQNASSQPTNTPGQNNPPAVSQGSNERPTVTFTTHTVQDGDTFWRISIQHGIPMTELLNANNMTESHMLQVGQVLTVPVHHIPVRPTVSPNHGELLDWWTEAQYVWPIGTVARIIDFETGRSWSAKRTIGAFHADVEPLAAADTAIMRDVWGGNWSWASRPVIIEVDGRRIAASANAMPHSIQEIRNNNFDGHFCVHFLNSTRHRDNMQCANHQRNVRTAAGVN